MKLLTTLLITATMLTIGQAKSQAAELTYNWGTPKVVADHTIGPGMRYTKMIYPSRPVTLWLVEIDLTNEYAKIEQVQSRHQVPDPLRWDVMTHYRENSRPGHQVKVAWNHDFFSYDLGVCIGLNISEGEVTWQKWGRSLLAFTDDRKAEVFYPSLDAHVTAPDGTSVEIDYYNALNGDIYGDCVLYNRFNSKTLTEAGTYVALRPLDSWRVNGQPVKCEVLSIGTEPVQTKADGTLYALYLRGAKINALDGHIAAGDILTVTQQFRDDGWGIKPRDILNAFHGYPSIVHDGVLHQGEYDNFENGREYEKSSRVMAGISKDKTRLYVVTTEMSSESSGVDCIELSAWLVERGAWDIVNFDSGGSAAIVIDETMLNIPGRGSVRPVQDAMLAVSLAPQDSIVDHMTFAVSDLAPMAISRTPLRVLSFNSYDEVLDDDVQGCEYECIPSTLGYVDNQGVFHASADNISGQIIARKGGKEAVANVAIKPVQNIAPVYTSFLIDDQQHMICGIQGTTDGEIVEVDAGGLDWTAAPAGIVEVNDGVMCGLSEGQATLTASFRDLTFDIAVDVEIVDKKKTVLTCSDPQSVSLTTSTTVKNLTYDYSSLPSGWNSGMTMNFDLAGGRGSNVKIAPKATLYSLPDSISMDIHDKDNIVTKVTFALTDAQGERLTYTSVPSQGTDRIFASFKTPGQEIDFYRYPLTLNTVTIYLKNKAVPSTSLSLGSIEAYYPGYSNSISSLKADERCSLRTNVDGQMLNIEFDSSSQSPCRLYIYDAAGRVVEASSYNCTLGHNVCTIDIKDLPSGIYFVSLRGNNHHDSAKFILN